MARFRFPGLRSGLSGTRGPVVAARRSVVAFTKIRLERCSILIPALLFICVDSGAAKTLDELARTSAEKFVVASLRKNGGADLRLLPETQRKIRGSFLKEILFDTSDSEIASRTITISGAAVDGPLGAQGEYLAPATRNVVFRECTFDVVALYAARFEQGLTFGRSIFHQGLFLNRIHVKGDLLLSGVRPGNEGESIRIRLDGAHIDGQLTMQDLQVSSIEAPGLTAQIVRLDLPAERVGLVDFSQLEADSLSLNAAARGAQPGWSQLGTVLLREASIKKTLHLAGVQLDELDAQGLRVDGRTDVEDGAIRSLLDLSWANLGTFRWVLPCQDACWPAQSWVSGVSFRELEIFPGEFLHSARQGDPKLGLEFFSHAEFSESGYTAYEQSLRSRGLITEADSVNRAMRDHKRDQTWRESKGFLAKLVAAVSIAIDLGQKVFLGYGRSVLPPLLWSLVFVIFGTAAFWNLEHMEPRGEQPPQYSAFWYSLELFLPVVDLGVAKSWRPSQKSFPLLTYARIHQLAGWILIPVALGAITGAFK